MKVLLYYKYVAVADPAKETEEHRALAKSLDLRGRILISSEGINGTCSGTPENIEKYKAAMDAHPLFSGISFKESDHPRHAFAKLFVRLRPEIVTLRNDVTAEKAAAYISPKELHELLEAKADVVLIDMRNDYEAVVGRFKDAVTLTMRNFRDLPGFIPELAKYKDRAVVTYCTGGIRCERASALLKTHGFTNVRQLEGGIVRYCEEFPDGHFEGSLFVFDDRKCMRFPGKLPHRFITNCEFCNVQTDNYVDCVYNPCHRLFICCKECEAKNAGRCANCVKSAVVV